MTPESLRRLADRFHRHITNCRPNSDLHRAMCDVSILLHILASELAKEEALQQQQASQHARLKQR